MASSGESQSIKVINPRNLPSSKDPTPCAVCHRSGCRLRSHKAWSDQRLRESRHSITPKRAQRDYFGPKVLGQNYTRSYAFTRTLPSTVPHSISSGRLDGFHDLPIPGGEQPELHQAVYSLLNFKVGSATAFPLPAGLAVNDIGGSMIIPVMTNTTLCFSVIAAWKAVQSLTGHSTNLPYLSYEAQALQSLRKQLLVQGFEAITDAAVTAAALLWATATMFPQSDALRRHAAGVRSLVNARCGLDKLGGGGAIQQLILWADFLTAQFLGEDVLFKEADNALGRLPTSLADIYDSFIIPSTFECALPETIKAAKDLRLLLTCHDRALRTGRISVAEYKALMNLLNRSTIQRISLEHQFKNSNSTDECAILAMNLMRLTVLFTATSLPTIVIKVIERLQDALIRCGLDRSMHCLDTYIWVCFVGMVHEINTPVRDELAQLVGRALKIKYESLVPGDWQPQTLSMLRSFLWSDAVLTDLFADACRLVDRGYGSLSPFSQAGILSTSLSLREQARKPVPNRFLPDRHHSAP